MNKPVLCTFEKSDISRDGAQGRCAYIIENNKAPAIHLFEITENPGRPLNETLIEGCQAIRDQVFPGTPLSAIQWKYTSGICHSEIAFSEKLGRVEKIHLSSDDLGGEYFKRPIAAYETALNAPEGFENNMSSGHGFRKSGASDIFPIEMKGVDGGYFYFKPCGYRSENAQTVLADSRKFIGAWMDHEQQRISQAAGNPLVEKLRKNFGFAAGANSGIQAALLRDYELFHSSREESLSHISHASTLEAPIDTALISFNADSNSIAYINGRHRTFNTANAGSDYVAVTVEGDVEKFKEKFEWRGEQSIKKDVTLTARIAR